MTLLYQAVEAKKFDTRVVERNVTRGVIRQDDATKVSKDLPDDGANAEFVSLDDLAADESAG